MATDHLSEVVNAHGEGSTWNKLTLKRSKATAIIKNVVAEDIKEELKKAVAGKKFSVLIDESTDITITKLMAVLIRYFNEDLTEIVTEYAGTVVVVGTTGQELFDKLKVNK